MNFGDFSENRGFPGFVCFPFFDEAFCCPGAAGSTKGPVSTEAELETKKSSACRQHFFETFCTLLDSSRILEAEPEVLKKQRVLDL